MALLERLWAALRAGPGSDEEPREIPSEPEPEMQDEAPVRCGAWAGLASMINASAIKRDVNFAVSLGLTRLDVLVNDHSASRAPRIFDTYPRSKIIALCKAADSAGIEVVLTSWIMPHEAYLRRMGVELGEIADAAKIAEFCFDAQEPWSQARDPMPRQQAAHLCNESMGELRWGVTGIGYADRLKMAPLVRGGSFMLPKCYATNNPRTAPPEQVAPRYCERWRNVFGEQNLVVGLAAYDQSGISHHTVESAMRAAFQGAMAMRPSAITWWSLGAIRKNARVSTTIRTLTQIAAKPQESRKIA